MADAAVPDPRARIPRQMRYIIGNEGVRGFSFHGMRNILTVFLATSPLCVEKRKKLRCKNSFVL
jgi:proton-dependent oligopeptide transporter, POT family